VRIFVFGYDRFDTMTTSLLLGNHRHVLLLHGHESRFRDGGTVGAEADVVETGNPRGLQHQRNAALSMMAEDEWALWLVDDLIDVTEVADYDRLRAEGRTRYGITTDNQTEMSPYMKRPITIDEFRDRAVEVATACEAVGAAHGGFAAYANPPWRDRKWRFNVLVDGRALLVKNVGQTVDPAVGCIDDLSMAADAIARDGIVVVNQWVLPECVRYGSGGYGSIDDRLDEKLAAVSHLQQKHPGLVSIRKKAGQPIGSHAVLRRTLDRASLSALESAVVSSTRET